MTKAEKKEIYKLVEYVKRMGHFYITEAQEVKDKYKAIQYQKAGEILQYIEACYIGEKMWKTYDEMLKTEKPWEA